MQVHAVHVVCVSGSVAANAGTLQAVTVCSGTLAEAAISKDSAPFMTDLMLAPCTPHAMEKIIGSQ